MKISTQPKHGCRWIAVALCLTMILSMLAFVSCGESVEQPARVDKVYSVSLQYNGATVEGQLSVDISMRTLSLKARILQDGGALATYESSNPEVATISSNGIVSLLSVGETAITARAGDKLHSIVLIVNDDYSSAATYSITVNGGVAKNAKGETVSAAKEGEYLTLVPAMPKHKDFLAWNYSIEGLWTNGNVIKMPAGNLSISAEYTDTLYKLNLIGATVTKAGEINNPTGTVLGGTSIESVRTVYEFPYGTEITVSANTPDSSRLFVGWDENAENNRVGTEGIGEYTFNMKGEDTNLTAVFSDISHNILPGANVNSAGESTSIFNGSGITGSTAKKITAGVIEGALTADPDLQSLYGYSFSIPANTLGSSAKTENILKSDLQTRDDLEPKTIKIIFKNRSKYPVTVELGYSYFGNYGSTGVVTVPAGEIVTRIFNSNIGLNDCSWSFMVRESIGGKEGETVELDVVAAAAKTYPTGYPLLKGSEDTEYVQFGGALTLKTGWKNGGSRLYFEEKGGHIFVSRASNMNASQASSYAKITNLPEYDPENPTTTIYVQVLNLVNVIDNPKNKFTIMVSNSTDAFNASATVLDAEVVDITEAGQVILLKLDLPRSADEGDLYMHFVKYEKETGMEYNMFAQFAYNNAFGYVEE